MCARANRWAGRCRSIWRCWPSARMDLREHRLAGGVDQPHPDRLHQRTYRLAHGWLMCCRTRCSRFTTAGAGSRKRSMPRRSRFTHLDPAVPRHLRAVSHDGRAAVFSHRNVDSPRRDLCIFSASPFWTIAAHHRLGAGRGLRLFSLPRFAELKRRRSVTGFLKNCVSPETVSGSPALVAPTRQTHLALSQRGFFRDGFHGFDGIVADEVGAGPMTMNDSKPVPAPCRENSKSPSPYLPPSNSARKAPISFTKFFRKSSLRGRSKPAPAPCFRERHHRHSSKTTRP